MKLSFKEKFAYGIGAVGKDMVYMLTAAYVLYYYENILGISALFTGMLLMAARVFDAINDPIMGMIVAKTRTKFGKFRPWIFSGTILNALVLYAMFSVPEGTEGTALLVYASVAYILWGVTYTMMDIPYWSMIPAFAKDAKEKESMSTLGRTCAGVGSAIVTISAMPLIAALGAGNERLGFKYYTFFVAAFFIFSAIVLCSCIKEKSTVDMPTVSIKEMFNALISNDQAMSVVTTIVILNCSVYLTSNLVIYFFKYDFGGASWENSYALFNTFSGAMSILTMMFIYPLIRKKFGTIQVFKMSLLMTIFGYALLLALACTNMSNIYLLFIPGFFISVSNGMLTILTTIFLANTVDYGEWKNGRRDESIIFSMQTFVVKLASGISALLASICLSVFHISQSTDAMIEVANSSIMGLRMTMTLGPICGLLIAYVYFNKKYILDDNKVDEITKELRKRA